MSTDATAGHAPTIDPTTLSDLIRSGSCPKLLDVRTPGEFQTSHIPGAYNVPLDTLREHRKELRRHLDQDVILICQAGLRAIQAEQALAEAGLPNLRVLDGGVQAWKTAGGELTYGPSRWDLERQVRLIVGVIVVVTGLVGLFLPGAHLIGTAMGAGLTFAAVTNTCAMGMALSKLPYNRGPRTDIRAVISSLKEDR
jgi:rhodanese-related sulfurtransferase